MTDSRASYDAICAEVRERWVARTDGDLMLVFLDDSGRPLLTLDVDEGTRHLDELFLRHVCNLIAELSLPGVVVVVLRRSGMPLRSDRRLRRELDQRLAGGRTGFLNFLVVGEETWWSAVAPVAPLPGAA